MSIAGMAGSLLAIVLGASLAAPVAAQPAPPPPASSETPSVVERAPGLSAKDDERPGANHHDDDDDQASRRIDPPRYVALASAGMPLRLTVQEEYGQDRLGASYVDLLAGYVLPGASYRHGFGIGVSWNLSRDGGYVAPIYTADQIVIMPAYLGYVPLTRDFVMLAHLGVPIVVRGGVGPGLEIGSAFLFHLLAGAGIFAEVDLTGFAAGDASVSVLASLEAGIAINYEVLP
ncbi:MAG TPA: hypothetical protein VFG30_42605 [Polyangiales bacterium]|nr:hypothetical protein [Polyangiales bacterium]